MSDFKMVYRPYVYVSRDPAGEWAVKFDWADTFIGYEDGDDFIPDDMPNEDDELYSEVRAADDFLGQFLKDNGVWDVSVY